MRSDAHFRTTSYLQCRKDLTVKFLTLYEKAQSRLEGLQVKFLGIYGSNSWDSYLQCRKDLTVKFLTLYEKAQSRLEGLQVKFLGIYGSNSWDSLVQYF